VTEFSARTRAANLDRLASETFDVLVVGGGVVGSGVARDAATRGLRTALVERDDFASGTSGKTSRLVHGGLRYLREYRVGLVRQAVRERDRLLATAPSLVHPLPFVIPAYRDRRPSSAALRFGLFLYDFLSRDKTVPRRVWLRPGEARMREPRLDSNHLRGAGIYYDAWTDDARLVLAIVKDAAAAGAVVANHAGVAELLRTDGAVRGARIHDAIRGTSMECRARVIVNATGVTLDDLRTATPVPTIRPTKGIHVFLPRSKVGNREALALTVRKDGRVVFVLPWGDLALVGTTDTDFHGDPREVLPDASDVDYLLAVVNDAFPDAHVGPEDVVSAYAGLRPLLRKGRSDVSESEVSREHVTFEDIDGLLSVAGGKLTTHRAMAEDVVDRVAARLDRRLPCVTRDRPFGPETRPLGEFSALGLDEPVALHLQDRTTPHAIRPYLDRPNGRERLIPDQPHLWAEVELALDEEMALSLADVLIRRLGLFYVTSDQALGVADAVADRMARFLGWDDATTDREVAAYAEIVRKHRAFRERHGR